MILIKIFNFCWKIANQLIYIRVYVESRGFCLASPPNIFFISKLIIIDWSITLCDVTPKSRIITIQQLLDVPIDYYQPNRTIFHTHDLVLLYIPLHLWMHFQIRVSYKKQELLTLREHMSSPLVFRWVSVAHIFSFVCCSIMCIFVLSSVLWCPLRFPHKNDVRFFFFFRWAASVIWLTILPLWVCACKNYKICVRNIYSEVKNGTGSLLTEASHESFKTRCPNTGVL